MIGYYLSKLKLVDQGMGPMWRHRMQELENCEFRGGGVRTGEDGTPVHACTLCVVDEIDHTRYRNDPEILPLPSSELSVKLGSIGTEEKLALRAGLEGIGIPAAVVAEQTGNEKTLRTLLVFLGKMNDDLFNIDAFSVY